MLLEITLKEKFSGLRAVTYFKVVFGSPSKFFILFGMIVGLIFVITSPPGFGLDERAHFMRTYLISSGQFLPQRLPVTNEVGAYLPLNLVQFVGASTKDILDNNTARFFVNRHDTDLTVYKPFFLQPFSKEKVNDYSTNNQLLATLAYSPFGYLHMATATKVIRLLDAPMIYAMYLSRFVNLVLYLVLIYWAIKVIPRYKWLLVGIGLLPTAIFQASSMSLDPFVTGLSVVATAYAVKFWLAKRRSITTKDVLIVVCVFVGIALIKTPYICLLLLFLGLPSNRFISRTTAYMVKTTWLTLTMVFTLGWVYINRSITPSLVLLQPGHADVAEQIRFIISKPIDVTGIIIKTHYESIDHTLASFNR